jgi:hypothetical protein
LQALKINFRELPLAGADPQAFPVAPGGRQLSDLIEFFGAIGTV